MSPRCITCTQKALIILLTNLTVKLNTPSHLSMSSTLTPPHSHAEKRCYHLSFPWCPVDCACTREGRPHHRKENPILNFDCCVFLQSCANSVLRGALIFHLFLAPSSLIGRTQEGTPILKRNHHFWIVVSCFIFIRMQSGCPHLSLSPSNCEGAERKAPSSLLPHNDGSGHGIVSSPRAAKATSSFLCVHTRRLFSRSLLI